MTDNVTHMSPTDLLHEACRLRIAADQLMSEAFDLDGAAQKLEERLARLGLRSPYVGSLERERTAFRLLDDAGIYVRVLRS